MAPFNYLSYRYLSKDIIDGFDNYEYSSVDTSPVSKYICHPFWNRVVEYVPKTIAPNILTLAGFLCLVLNYAVSTYYDPKFYASSKDHPEFPPIPNVIWLMCSFTNFMSHTLDGIDGKQARRTGSSSPLGELFDHGLDSWATFFLPMALYSLFGRGEHGASVYTVYHILLGIMTCFILSHWEKYNTKVLFLPWGYDISQLSMTVVYFITYLFTYEIWIAPLPVINAPMSTAIVVTIDLSFILIAFPQSFWNVYVSYRDKTGKMLSFYESMRPLISVIVLFVTMTLWLAFSPCRILEVEPRLFYWATSTIFSNIACRLIVSQMSATRADMLHWMILPLVATVAYILVNQCSKFVEVTILWIIVVTTTAAHLHYCMCVVYQMCEHFKIYAFYIPNNRKSK